MTPLTIPETMSIADVAIRRGTGGTKVMAFPITLATPGTSPISVKATTSDLTARAGVDYDATSQTLTFAPGETSKTFDVTIMGTPVPGPQLIFFVQLTDTTVPLHRPTGAGVLDFGS